MKLNLLKQQIKKEKANLKGVYSYIKNQLSDLDFFSWFGYSNEQKRVIRNLDMSWQQYDEIKQQIERLEKQYKEAKKYKLMR
jgi:hypothetical protein